MTDEKPRRGGGFGAMSPERRREVARKGGMSVDPTKRSFSQNPDLASRAGKIGGKASPTGSGRKPTEP